MTENKQPMFSMPVRVYKQVVQEWQLFCTLWIAKFVGGPGAARQQNEWTLTYPVSSYMAGEFPNFLEGFTLDHRTTLW